MGDADEGVFERVRDLVERGEYLDAVPGLPGVALTGGGQFEQTPAGESRRIYGRNTRAYAAARAAGLVERLPPLVPAPHDAVEAAEAALGAALPALLRRLYEHVGNGGFGPGYGLLGLRGGHLDDTGDTAISLWGKWKVDPRSLLPVCHWGCAIYSFVDCADGMMWGWDPNPVPEDGLSKALFRQPLTLAAWLDRWISGRLYQPTLVDDPTAGGWRGATDEEIEQSIADAGGEDE